MNWKKRKWRHLVCKKNRTGGWDQCYCTFKFVRLIEMTLMIQSLSRASDLNTVVEKCAPVHITAAITYSTVLPFYLMNKMSVHCFANVNFNLSLTAQEPSPWNWESLIVVAERKIVPQQGGWEPWWISNIQMLVLLGSLLWMHDDVPNNSAIWQLFINIVVDSKYSCHQATICKHSEWVFLRPHLRPHYSGSRACTQFFHIFLLPYDPSCALAHLMWVFLHFFSALKCFMHPGTPNSIFLHFSHAWISSTTHPAHNVHAPTQ